MSDLTSDEKPMRWHDGNLMHACVGERIVPFDHGTYVVWTKCGKHDVPANGAWYGADQVTCPECSQ